MTGLTSRSAPSDGVSVPLDSFTYGEAKQPLSEEKPKWVQSCVNAVSYPATIEHFLGMVESRLDDEQNPFWALSTDLFFKQPPSFSHRARGDYIPQAKKGGRLGGWTSPRWFLEGDIAFFYHTIKSRKSTARIYKKLKTSLEELDRTIAGNRIPALSEMSPSHKRLILNTFVAHRAVEFAERYSGTVFAVGRAKTPSETKERQPRRHWASRHYCEYDDLYVLETPIPYSLFSKTVHLQQNACTALTMKQFDHLRSLVTTKNCEPAYLNQVLHRDIPIRAIAEQYGWRGVARDPSVRFLFESQLREYLVDDFLGDISCGRKRFLEEVRLEKAGNPMGFVDYLISVNGQAVSVETKVYFEGSSTEIKQIAKYQNATLSRASEREQGNRALSPGKTGD